jgi:hypothetical protein
MIGNPRIQGPRALRIVGSVFLLIGLAGLVAAGVLALRESQGARSATADGVIVDFEYGPVVEFVTQDGRKGRLSSSVRSSFWHRGDRVAVAYSPDDPTDAAIDGFAGRWFLPGLSVFSAACSRPWAWRWASWDGSSGAGEGPRRRALRRSKGRADMNRRVMAGLVPAISIGNGASLTDRDGRHKGGHDTERSSPYPTVFGSKGQNSCAYVCIYVLISFQ